MKSISKRLTLRIMMVVLAMMAVIAGVVYLTVSEYMDDEAEMRFQIVVMRAHREIQRRLSDVYVATNNNVHEIERSSRRTLGSSAADCCSYPTIIRRKANTLCPLPPAIRQTWSA